MKHEIAVLSTYPPQHCGIATFTQDLIRSVHKRFGHSIRCTVAMVETDQQPEKVDPAVKWRLDPKSRESYLELAESINHDPKTTLLLVQHEFGLFRENEQEFLHFLQVLEKPVVLVCHTVLPNPNPVLKKYVEDLAEAATELVVMTDSARNVMNEHYLISDRKIAVIPHGTHQIPFSDKQELAEKYGLQGKKILSTFGLISSGKNMELTIKALPEVIAKHPEALFLAIGATHPNVVATEGEVYRDSLKSLAKELNVENHIRFIDKYVELEELLEYLQLTDIYLFTSRDPNQAVSGTLSYALSAGCPIISTPIAHSRELVRGNTGIIVDFTDERIMADAILRLLDDSGLRTNMSLNALHLMAPHTWENAAICYVRLFDDLLEGTLNPYYSLPNPDLSHFIRMTTELGMWQFAAINVPDRKYGYTLDDNARALIACTEFFGQSGEREALRLADIYLDFIERAQLPNGKFLNYFDEFGMPTEAENDAVNLEDSNGRAMWALGTAASSPFLPADVRHKAEQLFLNAIGECSSLTSPRALGFTLKGLATYNLLAHSEEVYGYGNVLGERLLNCYQQEKCESWQWFEGYLTYANSILPEGLLCAWELTHRPAFAEAAQESFNFLLEKIFYDGEIHVVSNKNWMKKGETAAKFGEQPIDVAYTILALGRFYSAFADRSYLLKMKAAFDWFTGKNHLKRMVYNPSTGGCMDGLEEHHVNLNQGAESTVSYMLARLELVKHAEEMEVLLGEVVGEIQNTVMASRKIRMMSRYYNLLRKMEEKPDLAFHVIGSPLFRVADDQDPQLLEKYIDDLQYRITQFDDLEEAV